MNTDVSLEFKSKLNVVTKKIKKIKNLKFDTELYDDELNKIVNGLNSKLSVSKTKRFEGFLVSDYVDAIDKLIRLENKLGEYDIYIRAYYYSKYLDGISVDKDNLNDIIGEIKVILNGLRNSSVIDYKDEAHIVEMFYREVYNVIKKEIELNNSHVLFDYCSNYDIDCSFLEEEIVKEINSLQIDNYSVLLNEYYKLMRLGSSSNLFNLDLITSIIYKDRQDEINSSIKLQASELIDKLNLSTCKVNEDIDRYNKGKESIRAYKVLVADCRLQLFKKICAVLIACSIPVGCFFGLGSIKSKKYNVVTKTYNSYTGKTMEEEDYMFNGDDYVKCIEYVDYNDYYVSKYEYELEFLGYDDIEDYIKYIEGEHNLSHDSFKLVSRKDVEVKDKVDYFEIIYRVVNENDYIYESMFGTGSLIYILLVFFVNLYMPSFVRTIINCQRLYNDLKNNKVLKKEKMEELKKLTKILLDEIKENDYLRLKFNEEISKHREIIDDLEYEIVDVKENSLDIKRKTFR